MDNSKTIIRTAKNRENPYVMINKHFLSDERLSWKAKGLLAYLLSKPDDWRVLVVDLIKQSKDGEKAVRSGLNELEQCGYLENNPVRHTEGSKKGQIIYWEKVVYEYPQPNAQNGKVGENEPDACFGDVGKGEVAKRDVEKAGLLINKSTDTDLTNELMITTTENDAVVVELTKEVESYLEKPMKPKDIEKLIAKYGKQNIRKKAQYIAMTRTKYQNVIGAFYSALKKDWDISAFEEIAVTIESGKNNEDKYTELYKLFPDN